MPVTRTRHATRSHPLGLPLFGLYGEPVVPGAELLHIEEVRSRSRLYQWEIEPHVHRGCTQVLWVRRGEVDAVLDDWRGQRSGPVAIVVPPGWRTASGLRPTPTGHVLTVVPDFWWRAISGSGRSVPAPVCHARRAVAGRGGVGAGRANQKGRAAGRPIPPSAWMPCLQSWLPSTACRARPIRRWCSGWRVADVAAGPCPGA